MGNARRFAWGLPVLIAVVGLAMPASAQNPKFEYGKREEIKQEEFKLAAQLGVLIAAGNSRSITISGGANGSYKSMDNRVSVDVTGALARTSVLIATDADGNGFIGPGEFFRQSTSATRAVNGKLRYDRYFGRFDAVYVVARLGFDQPAGKKIYGGGQAGYSRLLYKDDQNEITAELGYDLIHEEYVAAGSMGTTIHSGRIFLGYVGRLSPDTSLVLNAEFYTNLNEERIPQGTAPPLRDVRGIAKLEATTKLIGKINLRATAKLLYDNVPAPIPSFGIPFEPGFLPLAHKTDFNTELAVVVNFL